MDFLRRLFSKPQPPAEPWLPRVLPSTYGVGPSQREYVRKLHLAAAFHKRAHRDSFEHILARSEARLGQWAYEAFLHNDSVELLAARVSAYRHGWPYFHVKFWQEGARFLLERFRGQP
jgi:hypothetical protein